jgi:hypothetical protein
MSSTKATKSSYATLHSVNIQRPDPSCITKLGWVIRLVWIAPQLHHMPPPLNTRRPSILTACNWRHFNVQRAGKERTAGERVGPGTMLEEEACHLDQ